MKILKQTATNSYVVSILKDVVDKYLEYVIEAGKSINTSPIDKEIVDAFRDCLYGERYMVHNSTDGKIYGKRDVRTLDKVFAWYEGLSYEDKEAAVRGASWAIIEDGGFFNDTKGHWTLKQQHEYIGRNYCIAFLEKVSSIWKYAGLLRPHKIPDITFLITILAGAYSLEQHLGTQSVSESDEDAELLADIDRIIEKNE